MLFFFFASETCRRSESTTCGCDRPNELENGRNTAAVSPLSWKQPGKYSVKSCACQLGIVGVDSHEREPFGCSGEQFILDGSCWSVCLGIHVQGHDPCEKSHLNHQRKSQDCTVKLNGRCQDVMHVEELNHDKVLYARTTGEPGPLSSTSDETSFFVCTYRSRISSGSLIFQFS